MMLKKQLLIFIFIANVSIVAMEENSKRLKDPELPLKELGNISTLPKTIIHHIIAHSFNWHARRIEHLLQPLSGLFLSCKQGWRLKYELLRLSNKKMRFLYSLTMSFIPKNLSDLISPCEKEKKYIQIERERQSEVQILESLGLPLSLTPFTNPHGCISQSRNKVLEDYGTITPCLNSRVIIDSPYFTDPTNPEFQDINQLTWDQLDKCEKKLFDKKD